MTDTLPIQSLDGVTSIAVDEALRSFAVERVAPEERGAKIRSPIEALRLAEEEIAALREADWRKDRLLARVAHDLRSPLSAVAGALELLRSDLPEDRDWAADMIARQTRFLSRLIEDLLEVSRIHNGKLHLRMEPLDLADVLDHAIETARPGIDDHRHQLAADYPRGLHLEADPARLEQVFVNLLVNAAKYTPPGGRISLRASRKEGQLAVCVQDDGLGISPEKLADIFQFFAQDDRAMPCAEGGLGLGLAIVKELTELHGGTISAASDGVGLGSEFTVNLPAKAPATGGHDGEFHA